MKIEKCIIEKAEKIKFLAFDVDDVLTRVEIIILNNCEEIKVLNVKDGIVDNELFRAHHRIKTAWITGSQSLQIEKRAKDIDYLMQDCMNKTLTLEKRLVAKWF